MVTETHERVTPQLESRRFQKSTSLISREDYSNNSSSKSLRSRKFLSPITARLLWINFPTLLILLSILVFGPQHRDELFDARIESLSAQGEIIATALGEGDAVSSLTTNGFDKVIAQQLVVRLTLPIDTRARLFDNDGILIADSRCLLLLESDGPCYNPAGDEIIIQDLPPPNLRRSDKFINELNYQLGSFIDWVLRIFGVRNSYPSYKESNNQTAEDYDEVEEALTGESAFGIRQMSQGNIIVSVAIPVEAYIQRVGVLLMSVDSTDIEKNIAEYYFKIIQFFFIALAFTLPLSLILTAFIARPIRQLAQAADGAEYQTGQRNVIPDFTGRNDEIGELSRSLRSMTDAIYERLDATEAFASDVAHEIKNPLSSIRSAVETLSTSASTDQKEALVKIILDDVHRLDRLISDISDASRLDAELARADRTSVDLLDVANTLVDLKNTTTETSLMFKTIRIGDGPFFTLCIEDQIVQVLSNLLANAVSFSPNKGTVTIELRRFSNLIEISVEDEGPGIAKDKVEEIFDRFFSLRPGNEPFGTHSGLGLSISRQIVEAHSGSIHAENRYGPNESVIGARFVVALPAARS